MRSLAAETETLSPWQQAVLDELRKIRVAVERQPRPSHLTREDEARFLSVVALAVKGRAFSAAELLAHGTADAELREVLGNLTSRQVGKRLRALSGRDVGGFSVKAVKRDGAGTIWAVYVSAHPHADAGFTADRGV